MPSTLAGLLVQDERGREMLRNRQTSEDMQRPPLTPSSLRPTGNPFDARLLRSPVAATHPLFRQPMPVAIASTSSHSKASYQAADQTRIVMAATQSDNRQQVTLAMLEEPANDVQQAIIRAAARLHAEEQIARGAAEAAAYADALDKSRQAAAEAKARKILPLADAAASAAASFARVAETLGAPAADAGMAVSTAPVSTAPVGTTSDTRGVSADRRAAVVFPSFIAGGMAALDEHKQQVASTLAEASARVASHEEAAESAGAERDALRQRARRHLEAAAAAAEAEVRARGAMAAARAEREAAEQEMLQRQAVAEAAVAREAAAQAALEALTAARQAAELEAEQQAADAADAAQRLAAATKAVQREAAAREAAAREAAERAAIARAAEVREAAARKLEAAEAASEEAASRETSLRRATAREAAEREAEARIHADRVRQERQGLQGEVDARREAARAAGAREATLQEEVRKAAQRHYAAEREASVQARAATDAAEREAVAWEAAASEVVARSQLQVRAEHVLMMEDAARATVEQARAAAALEGERRVEQMRRNEEAVAPGPALGSRGRGGDYRVTT